MILYFGDAYVFVKNMKQILIDEILIPAIKRLYQLDYDNIRFGVSERDICARLAHHIENIMREYDLQHQSSYFENYYADVEYNRMGDGSLKQYENSLHRPQYMVSDLLVQTRGFGKKLLAVEMKRKGNQIIAPKIGLFWRMEMLLNRLSCQIFPVGTIT